MKIVMIGTTANRVLDFRRSLIRAAITKGHEVYAFANNYSEEHRASLKILGAVPVDYKLARSGLNIFTDIKMMFELKSKIETIQPDVVLSYFIKPVIYGTLAASLAKTPVRIAMLEGLGYIYTPNKNGFSFKKRCLQILLGILFTLSFRCSTKIIFLNPDDPRDLASTAKFCLKKIEILGGIGLELEDYPYSKPKMNKPFRFIFVGRLLTEKGVLDVIKAMSLVKEKYKNTELVVLGELDQDNPSSLTQESIDDLIRQETIIYPGQVDNVRQWLESSHVFVLPSFREGFPLSTQEAMAIGRPILTTDVPGCRETVKCGANGFLVPAFDVARLAEKMIWFIEHPGEIERMGLASRQIAEEKFDAIKINARILEIMRL
jgi:glycosyltransferase involved in cell wall biosynthesis